MLLDSIQLPWLSNYKTIPNIEAQKKMQGSSDDYSRMRRLEDKMESIVTESHISSIALVRVEEKLRNIAEDIAAHEQVTRSIRINTISAVLVAIAGAFVSLSTLGLQAHKYDTLPSVQKKQLQSGFILPQLVAIIEQAALKLLP